MLFPALSWRRKIVLGDGTVHPQKFLPPAERSEAGGLTFVWNVYSVNLYLFPLNHCYNSYSYLLYFQHILYLPNRASEAENNSKITPALPPCRFRFQTTLSKSVNFHFSYLLYLFFPTYLGNAKALRYVYLQFRGVYGCKLKPFFTISFLNWE